MLVRRKVTPSKNCIISQHSVKEQKATAEAFIYGRLSTGIGKSVCYESLLFVHDFKGRTVSNFYLCLEATVAIVILPLISMRS